MYTYIHISHYIPPGFDVTGVRGSFCSMCGPTLVLKAGVPKSGVPQNGWFIRETSIKMMNRIEQRYPFFRETFVFPMEIPFESKIPSNR